MAGMSSACANNVVMGFDQKTLLGRLSAKLTQDIQARGLRTGDRYLTSEQAGEMLQVSTVTANRAMRVLAEQELLVRQRKNGTFVGPKFQADNAIAAPAVEVVHVLMPAEYYRSGLASSEVFVDQLNIALPGSAVQIHHVPDWNAARYSLRIIDQIKSAEERKEAIILLRATREVQRYAEESGIPTVVFGSIYPDVKGLAWLDVDQEEAGRLGARHALGCGHKRFALIMRNEWRRGDNLVLSGVRSELGKAGVGVESLTIVSVPTEPSVVLEEIKAILAQPDPPTAFLCRASFCAKPVVSALNELGRKIGCDVDVVDLQNYCDIDQLCNACVVPKLSLADQIVRIGGMLKSQMEKQPLGSRGEIIPVELQESSA